MEDEPSTILSQSERGGPPSPDILTTEQSALGASPPNLHVPAPIRHWIHIRSCNSVATRKDNTLFLRSVNKRCWPEADVWSWLAKVRNGRGAAEYDKGDIPGGGWRAVESPPEKRAPPGRRARGLGCHLPGPQDPGCVLLPCAGPCPGVSGTRSATARSGLIETPNETASGMGFHPFGRRWPGMLTPAHFLLSRPPCHIWSPRLALRGRVS